MVKRIESQKLVIKSNQLVEANYRLERFEQKIIYQLLMSIDKDDEDFKPYTFSVAEFKKMLGIKDENAYQKLAKHTKDLMGRVVTFGDSEENTTTQVAWISSAKYFHGKGIVVLKFDPEMKPYLLQLKESFTKLDGHIAIKLKSGFSIRLNELLQQYIKIGERTITINDLRKKLGIKDREYPKYANFKQRVILQAQKEINNHKELDISFEFEEIKTGRKVTAIRFIIKRKFVNVEKDKYKVEEINSNDKKEFEQIEFFVNKFNKKYDTQLAINPIKGLVKKKGFDHIEETFESFDLYLQLEKKKKSVNSVEGFFIHICNNGYHFSTSTPGTKGYEANFDQEDPKNIDYEQYYYKVSEDE